MRRAKAKPMDYSLIFLFIFIEFHDSKKYNFWHFVFISHRRAINSLFDCYCAQSGSEMAARRATWKWSKHVLHLVNGVSSEIDTPTHAKDLRFSWRRVDAAHPVKCKHSLNN